MDDEARDDFAKFDESGYDDEPEEVERKGISVRRHRGITRRKTYQMMIHVIRSIALLFKWSWIASSWSITTALVSTQFTDK